MLPFPSDQFGLGPTSILKSQTQITRLGFTILNFEISTHGEIKQFQPGFGQVTVENIIFRIGSVYPLE